MKMIISEMPSNIWSLQNTFNLRIGRSYTTVAQYLSQLGVTWIFGDDSRAEIRLYKEDVGPVTMHRLGQELIRRLAGKPAISLIGEPREFASASYRFAKPERTLAVAPGNDLKRLYFASEWIDPQLEDWHKRLDRFCWIARPTADRLQIAEKLVAAGIPLDIYSRDRWSLSQWQGYAEDEIEVSRRYRYRLVCENSLTYCYHSEKLFNSIRCGCVTFYSGDPNLDLSHAAGAYLPLDYDLIACRGDSAPRILEGMEQFMFSTAWEIYSFRKFYDRIVDLARER